jgi:hypothetical protein
MRSERGKATPPRQEETPIDSVLREKERELVRLRAMLAGGATAGSAGGMNPENVVWMFGTGRSGSTWLSGMMGDLKDHAVWREPLVGALFGNLYYVRANNRGGAGDKHFILGSSYKDTWLGPMRSMVLMGAAARFPEVVGAGYLVIKEPNGSAGAPLLMEALPESRMIFLVRDPRDVVASSLDARKEGGWLYERRGRARAKVANKNPDRFVRVQAENYVRDAGNSWKAYQAHEGLKFLVKYEELREDALDTMKRLYSALRIPVDERELARVVEEHAWESIPEEKKGEGRFYRKASPGSWREDLTPEQAETIEIITAPLLEEFYPSGARGRERG